jgi:arginyl-tRNA synthetase
MMKQLLEQLILQALTSAHENGSFSAPAFPEFVIEVPKNLSHGDYSCNIAMVSAAILKMSPRKIAETIIKYINDTDQLIDRVDIAGPGFINFYLRPESWIRFLIKVHEQGIRYGAANVGKGKKIQVEFVSSNPTGPLHVGHGRGAAVGDSVANILSIRNTISTTPEDKSTHWADRSFFGIRNFWANPCAFPMTAIRATTSRISPAGSST